MYSKGKIRNKSDDIFFIKDLLLQNNIIEKVFFKGDYYGSVTLENKETKFITIDSSYYDLTTKSNIIPVTKIDKIEIIFQKSSSEAKYNFSDFIANSIILRGETDKENVLLRNCKTKEIKIIDLINSGQIRFHNIELIKNGLGEFISSRLGKMEFSDVRFNLAERFTIYYSNLTEIIITNTDFPNDIKGRNNNDSSEVRETYRQLKYAASKQGDKIRELFYEKYEFKSYSKGLKWYSIDKIILFTNQLSNDYGTDWFRSLILLLVFGLIFFLIARSAMGDTFRIGMPTWLEISQYFNFTLNPLHDFNKVFFIEKDDKDYGAARTIDVFGKLICGYLIFQLLRAFRKYSR